MKKLITAFVVVAFSATAHSQTLPVIFKKSNKNDSLPAMKLPAIFSKNKPTSSLGAEEIAAGLKQALQVGAERATGKLSTVDGFFKNAALKILMPAEAKKLESTLRSLGMNKQVDAAILAMNRAAEDAAISATPIFVQAVKGITIQDAVGILRGGDKSATAYLRTKIEPALLDAFSPVISESLKKVDATKYWTTITTAYNTVSREKVTTDLTAYVTEKALSGIFLQLAEEEQKIRKDPAARTTDLLRKVFAQ